MVETTATLMRRNLVLARPEMFYVPAGFHASALIVSLLNFPLGEAAGGFQK